MKYIILILPLLVSCTANVNVQKALKDRAEAYCAKCGGIDRAVIINYTARLDK